MNAQQIKSHVWTVDAIKTSSFFSFIYNKKGEKVKKENTTDCLNKWPTNGHHSWAYNKWGGERREGKGKGKGEGECQNEIFL